MPIPSICWLVALVILAVVEGATATLVSLWFALGALAALITSFFVDNIWIQFAVFLVVSLVTLLVIRPLTRRYDPQAGGYQRRPGGGRRRDRHPGH